MNWSYGFIRLFLTVPFGQANSTDLNKYRSYSLEMCNRYTFLLIIYDNQLKLQSIQAEVLMHYVGRIKDRKM